MDVEDAADARDDLDRGDLMLVLLQDSRCQTGSVGPSASGDAVLDPDVRGSGHRPERTLGGEPHASSTTGGATKSHSAERWPIGSFTGTRERPRSAAVSEAPRVDGLLA